MSTALGQYFTLNEMTVSAAAARAGLRNVPNAAATEKLRLLVGNILDPLRAHLGRPVVVTSGFRSDRVNALVGGARSSQHRFGEAADIIVPGLSVAEVVQAIKALCLPFDQLIDEHGDTASGWTHVSYSPRHRREYLLARRRQGRVVYTHG